jgi:hypothetical protein
MGLVISMVMITVGAIMRFAVSATAEGFNVGTVGMILMLVGVLGAVMSIVFWASWGGFGPRGAGRSVITRTVAAPPQHATVVERTVVERDTGL